MKKLLALILSLALTLSLAAPAFAAEARPMWEQWGYESLAAYLADTDTEEWSYYGYQATPAEQKVWTQAWLAAHPDMAALFSPNDYFRVVGSGWTDKDAYMRSNGLKTDEEFQLKMAVEFTTRRAMLDKRYIDNITWLAARGEEFDPSAWFAKGYHDMNMSEAEYRVYADLLTDREFIGEMLSEYRWRAESNDEWRVRWAEKQTEDPEGTAQAAALLAEQLKAGGYESAQEYVDVFTNGRSAEELYLQFYYQWSDEKTVSSARAERITALGGVPGQINVLLDDRCVDFGSRLPKAEKGVLSLPADILSDMLSIPVTPGEDGYAPLRSNADKAGFYLNWDAEYQTAVLINKNKAITDIDSRFTKLGRLWDGLTALYLRSEGQSYQINETVKLDLTMLNSMDGDKTYTAKVTGASTVQDGILSASLALDLSGVWKALSPELKDAVLQNLPQTLTIAQMAELAQGVKVELILNPSEALYFKAPVLATLLDGYEADSWVRVDLKDVSRQLTEGPVPSLGALLWAREIEGRYYYDLDSNYTRLMAAADTVAAFVGDERFTEHSGTLSYKLDTQTVNDFLRSTGGLGEDFPDVFRAADVSASLTESGKLSLSVDMRPNTDAYAALLSGGSNTLFYSFLTSLLDTRFTAKVEGSADKTGWSMSFHWRNQLKADLSYSSQAKKATAVPASVPPAGSKVVDWADVRYLLPF